MAGNYRRILYRRHWGRTLVNAKDDTQIIQTRRVCRDIVDIMDRLNLTRLLTVEKNYKKDINRRST